MNARASKLTLDQWDQRYVELVKGGLREPPYRGPLRAHLVRGGDLRLGHLKFDNSPAALRLWNFLLSENDRLAEAREQGAKIVGAMKDLGTVPVMAFALPNVRAFYPDGSWWTPCLMECSDGLLAEAEGLGLDASFCPVRAMVPAFLNGQHFPRPELLICSTGAICDDFSAIAQRLEHLGYPIVWWEMPRRRHPEPGEAPCLLPGGLTVPETLVECVCEELQRVAKPLADLAGSTLTDDVLAAGIRRANQVRHLLDRLRCTAHSAPGAPLPALEMLIAEMLAIHFCSDLDETIAVLRDLVEVASRRVRQRDFVVAEDAVRIFWVNPVADLRAMNRLEELGGRICGTDYMFTHALDPIPEGQPPFRALAQMALADPMVGPTQDRAARIVRECRRYRAEAVVVSRIPGASHCAHEGTIIREVVQEELGIPSIELEIPPICDAFVGTLNSRLQAVIEVAQARRRP